MSPVEILIVVAIIAVVAGAVVYARQHPAAAKADIASLTAAVHRAAAALEKPTVPVAAVPGPVGKNGVAGTFSIAVTGTPAADMAAINNQYFG